MTLKTIKNLKKSIQINNSILVLGASTAVQLSGKFEKLF